MNVSRQLALAGLLLWQIALDFLPERGLIGEIERIILFSVFVLIPMQLDLSVRHPADRGGPQLWFAWARRLYVPAALLLLVSLQLDTGVPALLAALPWLLFSLCCALAGLLRLSGRGIYPVAETAHDFGWIFFPVGAVWLGAHRLGYELLEFPGLVVLLTAAHFHFAGLAAPWIAGAAGRLIEYDPNSKSNDISRKFYRIAATLIVVGIPLTAAGIAVAPVLELFAAVALSLGLAILAVLLIVRVAPRSPGRMREIGLHFPVTWLPAIYLVLAGLCVLYSMVYAVHFATGEFFGVTKTLAGGGPAADVLTMVRRHGWVNALGFAGLGVAAMYALQPPSRSFPSGLPFSRLVSRGRVGRDFFERHDLVRDDVEVNLRGLTDDLLSYDRRDFSAARLPALLRRFYEDTANFRMIVRPRWVSAFRLPAALYKAWFSGRIEQMNFPLVPESGEERITSRILPLRSEADGRENVRAWVRHYTDTGKAVYAAAYSQHTYRGRTFMNIAFPLPGGNLTSVLRLYEYDQEGVPALALTSLPDEAGPGDEGVYFVLNAGRLQLPLRLPINETIRVWQVTGAERLLAEHDMWIFGFRCLTLEYEMEPA